MKHYKKVLAKRVAKRFLGRSIVKIPRKEVEGSAAFILQPFLEAGVEGGEIAERIGTVWAQVAEEMAGRLERHYGRVDRCRALRESAKPLHSAGLIASYSRRPKKFAEWVLRHFEKLPPLLHEEFIFLQALASKVDTKGTMPYSKVKRAFARAFGKNGKLKERLERHLREKGVKVI